MNRESAMLGSVASREVSAAVLTALKSKLPNDGLPFVDHVEVSSSWGNTYFVSVCSGISRHDAGIRLEESIYRIVGSVMGGRRHIVRIVWA
jgi:hypothetical protein